MFIGEMFDPFKRVYQQLNVKQEPIITDNWVYMLHRKWSHIFALISLTIMISYAVLVDANHFMVCYGPDKKTVPPDVLKEWCYLSGTYINPEYIGAEDRIGKDFSHPGIGMDKKDFKKVYHNHYVFYPVIFLVQFFLFRASKYIWKYMEGDRLKTLLAEMSTAVTTDEEIKKRIEAVADYMIHNPLTFHAHYSYRFIFCELFNASNVILQFLMINYALENEFLNFGWDAIAYIQRVHGNPTASTIGLKDPFTIVFPKVAKCTINISGPSGNIINHEAICILPWNNVAEKVFFFWWIWLTLLGFLTVIALLYRLVVMLLPCARYGLLRLRTMPSGLCDSTQLRTYCAKQSYGDWFVLSLIQRNLDSWVFASLVDELDKKQSVCSERKKH